MANCECHNQRVIHVELRSFPNAMGGCHRCHRGPWLLVVWFKANGAGCRVGLSMVILSLWGAVLVQFQVFVDL